MKQISIYFFISQKTKKTCRMHILIALIISNVIINYNLYKMIIVECVKDLVVIS